MGDTIELRDHSRPCEHTGGDWEDGPLRLGAYHTGGVWECFVDYCPGGQKIVLQKRRKYWHQADPEKADSGDTSTWFVPCDKKENIWVEVANE